MNREDAAELVRLAPYAAAQAHPLGWLMWCAGVTQAELPAATGYSCSQVSRVLAGRCRPTPTFRTAVGGLLGLPEDELFGGGRPAQRPVPRQALLDRIRASVPRRPAAADVPAGGRARRTPLAE